MLRHLDSAASCAWRAAIRVMHPPRLSLGAIRSSSISHLYSPYSGIAAHRTAQRPGLSLQCMLYSATPHPQPQPINNEDHPTDQTSSPSDVAADFATARPFSAIPSPRRIPLIGISRDFMKVSSSELVQAVYRRVEELGKIYREKLFPGLPEFVFVLDPEDVAKVFRADGRYPRRFPIQEWIDVKEELNIPIGLFLS